jgi:pimeloyl-[acyl-carrier protein] methyl ester esterase
MPQPAAPMTLVLLPGLDGTGNLFSWFIGALPPHLSAKVIAYPADQVLNYSQLLAYVTDRLPIQEPYMVLAESFSTPLVVHLAARHPANLKGLIMCAGFVTNPARSWLRFLQMLATPHLFRL